MSGMTNQQVRIPKIILGMSGGVDSSVCAYLLQKQGYEVIGLFVQNWDRDLNNDILGKTNNASCDFTKDFNDAKQVADKLGIKIYTTGFISLYWNKVFKYMIQEYRQGLTPNPDVLCNKFIKFDEFIKYAKKHFGCDQIAMGHYANIKKTNNKYFLERSLCEDKDQTYFLC
jgi:tRNA-specific 2-thiouridylase